MKNVIIHSIDWLSIKLNLICLIGFALGDDTLTTLVSLGTVSTIVYNSIKIYQALFNKNKNVE